LGFNDVSGDRSAKALGEHVSECLDEYGIGENKLVSQTYDRAAVIGRELYVLLSCVRQKYSYALFAHCYVHSVSFFLRPFVIQGDVIYF
jgi:hypothetical protein